jgi:hypothetical protein
VNLSQATLDDASVAAEFSVPFRPHLFSKPEPSKLHLTKTALERDEVFLLLVFIYSEVKRQDGTVRSDPPYRCRRCSWISEQLFCEWRTWLVNIKTFRRMMLCGMDYVRIYSKLRSTVYIYSPQFKPSRNHHNIHLT